MKTLSALILAAILSYPAASRSQESPQDTVVFNTLTYRSELSGSLMSTDSILSDGQYVDWYTFDSREVDSLVVMIVSEDFDPLLIIISPSGIRYENDDWNYSLSVSKIVIASPENGLWSIGTSSYSPDSTGNYTVSLGNAAYTYSWYDDHGYDLGYGSAPSYDYEYSLTSNLIQDDSIWGYSLESEDPGRATIVDFQDGTYWMLAQDLVWDIDGTGATIVVPRGFVTDLTSAPRIIWSIVAPTGRHQRAAIIHDYLYWTQLCERDESDRLMRLAMEQMDVNYLKSFAIYKALSAAGGAAWRQNEAEWGSGLPRIVPPEWQALDGKWSEIRRRLYNNGIRPGRRQEKASFCNRG